MATKKAKVKEEKTVLTANIVALRKNKVFIPEEAGVDNRIAVSTVQAHLMQYRYMLTEEAFDQLSKCDLSVIVMFHDEAIEYLKNMMGGKMSPKPLYKNFPEEVMSKSDSTLFWESLIMYWTGKQPTSIEMDKPIEFENVKYTMLKPVDSAGLGRIFTDLVSINTSLTPQDLEIIEWFASTAKGVKELMPSEIPFKENLMTLAAMKIPVPIKTTTDVLRIAVHMSGGDVSLPAVPPARIKQKGYRSSGTIMNPDRHKFRFRNFNRTERRYLLGLLEKTHCNPAEMVLKDQRWIRLGEILHPGDFKDKFPRSFAAFDAIRNTKVRSWYSKLTRVLYQELKLEEGLKILSERPGEFVRRLDWLFRTFTYEGNMGLIFKYLQPVLEKASNKVIFEVYTHFEGRRTHKNRSIMIKGKRKKTELKDLPPMKPELIDGIQSDLFVALRAKFAKLPALGNVWIDPELKKIPCPTNMRSLNPSLKPVVRGTRTKFDNPDAKVIRPFVHWKGPVDLDLSVTFVGSTKHADILNFSRMKIGASCHSGDVLHRSGPCAEYVDIVIDDAISMGYQYALIDVRNFSGGSLKNHEAVMGLMEREHPTSNKTWLPETITGAQQLEASGQTAFLGIIDLATKEYIHLDLDSDGLTARHDISNLMKTIDEYAKPPKFSVYDLLKMHAEARGRIVETDQKIDTYFKFEDFMHSYEMTASYML